MFEFAFVGIAGARVDPITFSGSLGGTGTGSSTISATTRTATVPAGHSGSVSFVSVDEVDGDILYSKNGGAFTAISEGTTITLANGDTLQMQGKLLNIFELVGATLRDNYAARDIETFQIQRTA